MSISSPFLYQKREFYTYFSTNITMEHPYIQYSFLFGTYAVTFYAQCIYVSSNSCRARFTVDTEICSCSAIVGIAGKQVRSLLDRQSDKSIETMPGFSKSFHTLRGWKLPLCKYPILVVCSCRLFHTSAGSPAPQEQSAALDPLECFQGRPALHGGAGNNSLLL